MMFIDSYDDVEQVTGLKYLNTVQDQNCTFLFLLNNEQRMKQKN
jgi:hypothetical protein